MDKRFPNDLKDQSSPDVMIFGSGACAQRIVANLAECGITSCQAAADGSLATSDDHQERHRMPGADLIRLGGFAGRFELQFNHARARLHETVPAIVVAEDDHRSANLAPYGLKPGPRVMAISTVEEKLRQVLAQEIFTSDAKIVFLCGWQTDSHSSIAKRMLDACLRLQQGSGIKSYFMTGNLKVAASGAEATVQEAKRMGAVFLKFTHDYPTIRSMADGRFVIDYPDELTRMNFQLTADWLIVDETIQPDRSLKALAHSLGIDCDDLGFAQADNVRRMSNTTNRRGIFVAGGSRDILSAAEQMADADQVSLQVLGFLQNLDAEVMPQVGINEGSCARCLTCHRLCPHGAIEIGDRIAVVTDACQRCGLCVASCPARAIEMEGVHIEADVSRRLKPLLERADAVQKKSSILIFGCARSAGQALASSRRSGYGLPEGVQFIDVPCGGTIAIRHLLTAFEAGADGVMLCTCHTGNCQAEIGNQVARKRADAARDLLTAAGVEAERLHVATLAANMDQELAFVIEAFVDHIDALDG